jgi:hypothetical protein
MRRARRQAFDGEAPEDLRLEQSTEAGRLQAG